MISNSAKDHWVVVDLIGKGRHIRTVPVPDRVKAALDSWTTAATIVDGRLRMPEMSGVDAICAIRSERPDSAVIVLTTYQGDEDIRKALAAGAQAYLVKGMSHLKLIEAIREVRAGHQYFPRRIRNMAPAKLTRPALSPRELDILRLIVKGLSNQEIAEALNITRGTVKWHVNIILRRLDVHDRTQAVVVATQRGYRRDPVIGCPLSAGRR